MNEMPDDEIKRIGSTLSEKYLELGLLWNHGRWYGRNDTLYSLSFNSGIAVFSGKTLVFVLAHNNYIVLLNKEIYYAQCNKVSEEYSLTTKGDDYFVKQIYGDKVLPFEKVKGKLLSINLS